MTKSADTPHAEDFTALYERAWDILVPARADYLDDVSPHYDEVLHEVAQRTEHTGSLGKTIAGHVLPACYRQAIQQALSRTAPAAPGHP